MVYTFDYDSSYMAGPAFPVVDFQLKAISSVEGSSLDGFDRFRGRCNSLANKLFGTGQSRTRRSGADGLEAAYQ